MRTEAVVKRIGDVIGAFLEWDNVGDSKWGRYLRLRTLVDLEKPLKKGTILKSMEGLTFRVSFKYERLMDFCYCCGRIGHLFKDCNEKEQEDDEDNSFLTFGPWIRASPTRSRQFSDKEDGCSRRSQKMIFRPENDFEKASHSTLETQKIILERFSKTMAPDNEELTTGTTLNDLGSKKEHVEALDTMLNSLSGCHISSTCHESNLFYGSTTVQKEGDFLAPSITLTDPKGISQEKVRSYNREALLMMDDS